MPVREISREKKPESSPKTKTVFFTLKKQSIFFVLLKLKTFPRVKVVARGFKTVAEAHGGKSGDSLKVVSWLHFVRRGLNWFEAERNCESLGGRLFADVDGTATQLQFLLDRMGDQHYWLGIRTFDRIQWKYASMYGEPYL